MKPHIKRVNVTPGIWAWCAYRDRYTRSRPIVISHKLSFVMNRLKKPWFRT